MALPYVSVEVQATFTLKQDAHRTVANFRDNRSVLYYPF